MRYYLSLIFTSLTILSSGVALLISQFSYDEATETHSIDPTFTGVWLIISVMGLALALSWMLVELFRKYACKCPRGIANTPQH